MCVWWKHYVVFISGALKYQTNIEAHPPDCFRANQSSTEQQGDELDTSEEEERRCNEDAHFQPHYPQVRVCVCVWVVQACVLWAYLHVFVFQFKLKEMFV